MKTRKAKLADLVRDARNPRTHDERNLGAIESSLGRYGQVEPIVVQRGTLRVIAGHGRLEAMERLGMKECSIYEVDVDDRGAKDLAVRLNRSAELAGWDRAELARTLAEIEEAGIDVKDVGFNAAEYDELAAELADMMAEEQPEEDEPEEELGPEAAPERCEPGQTWKLGDHLLVIGDSFELKLGELGHGKADCVITDPPYAIYGSSSGTGSDVSDDKMVRPFFSGLAKQLRAASKQFAHVYTFCDWRSYPVLSTAYRGTLEAKNALVWDKGGGGLGSNWSNCYELIAYHCHGPKGKTMTSRQDKGYRVVNGRSNILRFPRVAGAERLHNAAKPVELIRELLEASTHPNEHVLDPFAGSGSTLIAAAKSSRRCTAVEIEPRAADIIVARWEALTGLDAILA